MSERKEYGVSRDEIWPDYDIREKPSKPDNFGEITVELPSVLVEKFNMARIRYYILKRKIREAIENEKPKW